jgi:hypothetical protein
VHANLRGWYFSGRERGRFAATCRVIFTKSQRPGIFALPHCVAQRSIVAHDQAVATAIPAAHDMPCKYRLTGLQPASGRARSLLVFDYINKGGTAVDLTLRLNVLAVCAVFAFVGAILLGAF